MTYAKWPLQISSLDKKRTWMKLTDEMKERLEELKEWVKFYAPLIAMFVFFHHESAAIRARLDTTISTFQRSIDEVHKRADDLHRRGDVLHQEFIDLLKERRKED